MNDLDRHWSSASPDFGLPAVARTLTATCLVGLAHGADADAALAGDAAECVLEESTSLRTCRHLMTITQRHETLSEKLELGHKDMDDALCIALGAAFLQAGDPRWRSVLDQATRHGVKDELRTAVIAFIEQAEGGWPEGRPQRH